ALKIEFGTRRTGDSGNDLHGVSTALPWRLQDLIYSDR
ncbi:MAG: hypothetical protein QOE68_4786, partial [Thermoanaerobaculia bacterium]|nr:hypothetical protein [Thermoanaerobaculia bacterium]